MTIFNGNLLTINLNHLTMNYLLKGTSKLERISRFLTLTLVLDSFVPSARVMDREKISSHNKVEMRFGVDSQNFMQKF